MGLQLLALQLVLWLGVTFLFDVRVHVVWLAVVASLLATVGLACAAAPTARCRRGCACATRSCRSSCCPCSHRSCSWAPGLGRRRERQRRIGDPVAKILIPFAVIYLVVGVVLYGPLQGAV